MLALVLLVLGLVLLACLALLVLALLALARLAGLVRLAPRRRLALGPRLPDALRLRGALVRSLAAVGAG